MNTPTSQTTVKPGESDVDLTPAPLRLSGKSSALENSPAPETKCGPSQAQEEDMPSPIHSTPVSEAVDSVIDPRSRDSPVSFREKARSLAALVSKFEILDAVNNTDSRHGRTGRRLLRKPHSPSPGRVGRKRPEEAPATPPREEKVEDVARESGDVSPGHGIAIQPDLHDRASPAENDISSAGQRHIQSSKDAIDLTDSVVHMAQFDAAKPQGRLSGGLVAERMMLFEPSRDTPNEFRSSATVPQLKDPFALPIKPVKALPRSKTWRSVPENRRPPTQIGTGGPEQGLGVTIVEAEVHPVRTAYTPRSLPHKGRPNVTDLRRSFEAGAKAQQETSTIETTVGQPSTRQVGLSEDQPGSGRKPSAFGTAESSKETRHRGKHSENSTERVKKGPKSPRGTSGTTSPRHGNKQPGSRISRSQTTLSAFLGTRRTNVEETPQKTSQAESRPSVADLRKIFDAAEPSMQGSGLFKVLYSRRQTAPNLSKHLDGPSDVKKSEGWKVFRDASASYAQRSKNKLQKRHRPTTESEAGTQKTWRASLTSKIHLQGTGSSLDTGSGTQDSRRLVSIQEVGKTDNREGKTDPKANYDVDGDGKLGTFSPTNWTVISREKRSTYDGAAEESKQTKVDNSAPDRRVLSRSLKERAGAWLTSRKPSRKSSNMSTSNDTEPTSTSVQRHPWSSLNLDGCFDTPPNGKASREPPKLKNPIISRVRALQRVFQTSQTQAPPAPCTQGPECGRSSPGEEVLIAHATCRMHHPRPTRPIRLSSMKRIVSLRKSKDASEPTPTEAEPATATSA